MFILEDIRHTNNRHYQHKQNNVYVNKESKGIEIILSYPIGYQK
jgi:hypothetical protein